MRKLFNLSLGGNETTSNIKEENATLSIFVCVCVKQCVCVCVCVCVFSTWNYVLKKINLKTYA